MRTRVGGMALATGLAVTAAWADLPRLEDGRRLAAGGGDLDVGTYSAPTVADWNNDGRKDLVVGMHEGTGKIALFLNQGADFAPEFNAYTYIESAGVDITTGSGG